MYYFRSQVYREKKKNNEKLYFFPKIYVHRIGSLHEDYGRSLFPGDVSAPHVPSPPKKVKNSFPPPSVIRCSHP